MNKRIEIAEELIKNLEEVSNGECEKILSNFDRDKRYFLAGAGRSGFVMRGFAMRLMHMGYTAYVVGESTTPSVRKEDVLVIASGSGNTGSLISIATKAKLFDVKVLLLTANLNSQLAALADVIIKIPGTTPKVKDVDGFVSIQPMGTLIEQTISIVLDSMILQLMERENISSDEMFENHANLE